MIAYRRLCVGCVEENQGSISPLRCEISTLIFSPHRLKQRVSNHSSKNGRVYPFLITSLVVNVTSCKANYGVVRICRTDFSWTSSEMSGILRGKKKYVDVLCLVHTIH